MPCCVAGNCANRTEKGYRMFKFPTDDDRRRQWINNLRRKFWLRNNLSYPCENHGSNTLKNHSSRLIDVVGLNFTTIFRRWPFKLKEEEEEEEDSSSG
ncbi:hypothetical protein EAG_03752 [Camponotus floridanus]|uniref:THAP-type domain-containing protein n=1 Tax=Camponotus floridanus TaxID=104421 RepID=E2B157_CAMFO|nr:hypothetical protein EAG_03752 [Camponotus floridanus]